MESVHLHLLINHVPILLTIFSLFILLWGMYKKENAVIHLSMAGFVIAAVFSVIAMQTGEGAEDIIEKLSGISEALIHDHEELAELANYGAILLGLVALAAFAIEKYRPAFYKPVKVVIVVLAFLSAGLFSYTAYLGGQIRHSEIRESESSMLKSQPRNNLEFFTSMQNLSVIFYREGFSLPNDNQFIKTDG